MSKDKKSLFGNPASLKAALEGDLENALLAATPGGVEAQEKVGQTMFVANDTLPHKFNFCKKEDFEKMGIVFGEKEDDLFSKVALPAGWKKLPTDHSMWSRLVDHKGRERASIFYKAAFYDRDAFLNLTPRFSTLCDPENSNSETSYDERKKGNWFGLVKDGEEVIFKTKPIKNPTYEQQTALRKEADDWLDAHYPEWRDATKYWDQETKRPKVGQRKIQVKED